MVNCDYCGKPALLVTGEDLYPYFPELANKLFYRCVPCKAHVGCHPNSDRPLGRLANAELRKMKMLAHAHFDPLWKRGGLMKRGDAYKWLADQLGIETVNCHIGMFDVDMCRKVIAACKNEG